MQVSVYRYNPDLDEVPVMRDVQVELPEGKDLMVLDVLHLMKDEDPTLSFRRSCREGVCGSDGINMNGKNGLACITPVSQVIKRNKLVLRPLPGLPVVRDLVVDMSQFYNQYAKVQPYLVNKEAPPAQERLQSPEEREKLDGLYCQRETEGEQVQIDRSVCLHGQILHVMKIRCVFTVNGHTSIANRPVTCCEGVALPWC